MIETGPNFYGLPSPPLYLTLRSRSRTWNFYVKIFLLGLKKSLVSNFSLIFSSPEPKAHWWAYRIGRPPLSVCRPHSLNISSETTGPIEAKFHMEPPWDGGTKVCSNSPGHMTKMTAMPIYDKNLKKSYSPEPNGWWPWNLVCSIGGSSTTKCVQMVTLGWPWHILRQGQIWYLMLLYGKKVKQWIFQKLLSCMIWN